jgi:cytochrome c-type biogenesis protein CcmH/NrfG
MDRLAMLEQILAQNPDDTFARYGLAMEYSKAGDVKRALAEFDTLLEKSPEYIAGYQMAAQMLVSAERTDEARGYLERGIAVAGRKGNQHALSEMTMLLEEISR